MIFFCPGFKWFFRLFYLHSSLLFYWWLSYEQDTQGIYSYTYLYILRIGWHNEITRHSGVFCLKTIFKYDFKLRHLLFTVFGLISFAILLKRVLFTHVLVSNDKKYGFFYRLNILFQMNMNHYTVFNRAVKNNTTNTKTSLIFTISCIVATVYLFIKNKTIFFLIRNCERKINYVPNMFSNM